MTCEFCDKEAKRKITVKIEEINNLDTKQNIDEHILVCKAHTYAYMDFPMKMKKVDGKGWFFNLAIGKKLVSKMYI